MPKKKRVYVMLLISLMAAAGLLYVITRKESSLLLQQEEGIVVETVEDMGESEEESSSTETIFVHVCGAVKEEGVYELPAGSRYQDAISAAGGFREDASTSYLNLATVLVDGEKLQVPTEEEAASREALDEAEALAASEAADSLININTATKEELMTLPGIGEARAEAIIQYREENGGFSCIEDIMNVSGIKEASFAKLKEKIKVGLSHGRQNIGCG